MSLGARPVVLACAGAIVHRPRDLLDLRPVVRRRDRGHEPGADAVRSWAPSTRPSGGAGPALDDGRRLRASRDAMRAAVDRHCKAKGRAGIPALRDALSAGWRWATKPPDSVLGAGDGQAPRPTRHGLPAASVPRRSSRATRWTSVVDDTPVDDRDRRLVDARARPRASSSAIREKDAVLAVARATSCAGSRGGRSPTARAWTAARWCGRRCAGWAPHVLRAA